MAGEKLAVPVLVINRDSLALFEGSDDALNWG